MAPGLALLLPTDLDQVYSGYGLHDAWWRQHYGPGTNVYGDGPGSNEPTGTHGCVNIPFAQTQWLWNWAPVGTPVVIYE